MLKKLDKKSQQQFHYKMHKKIVGYLNKWILCNVTYN